MDQNDQEEPAQKVDIAPATSIKGWHCCQLEGLGRSSFYVVSYFIFNGKPTVSSGKKNQTLCIEKKIRTRKRFFVFFLDGRSRSYSPFDEKQK